MNALHGGAFLADPAAARHAVLWLYLVLVLVLGGVCAWVAVDSRRAQRRQPVPYNGRHRAPDLAAIVPVPDDDRTQPIQVGLFAFTPMTYRVTATAPARPPAVTCHGRPSWRITNQSAPNVPALASKETTP